MTTLVIGSGFVGAYVVRDIVVQGEDVVCYDIAANADYIEAVVMPKNMSKVSLVSADVTDLPRLLRTIREYKIRRIVHLAGLLSARSQENMPVAIKVNVQGTANVFEAASLLAVEKVVWMSSTAVFGPRSQNSDGMISNESPLDPTNIYGACKAFDEQLAIHYFRQYGVDSTGLRLSSVYGWGKFLTEARGTALTWLTELIDKPARQAGPSVVPYGDSEMDFLYIEDVARAVLLALDAKSSNGASYLISGDRRPVREAFECVRSLLPDAEMTLLPGIRPIQHTIRFDDTATRQDLGYSPAVRMEEGLKRTIDMTRKSAGLPPIS